MEKVKKSVIGLLQCSYPQYGGETCSNSDVMMGNQGNTEQRTRCSSNGNTVENGDVEEEACNQDCVTGFPDEDGMGRM